MIQALEETKGMVYLAADRLRCCHTTVYNYIKRHATVRHEFDRQNGKLGDVCELKLYKAIQDGEHWAIAFYLKTKGKDRGYTERKELDVKVHDVDREIEGELAKLAARGQDADAGSAEGTE